MIQPTTCPVTKARLDRKSRMSITVPKSDSKIHLKSRAGAWVTFRATLWGLMTLVSS